MLLVSLLFCSMARFFFFEVHDGRPGHPPQRAQSAERAFALRSVLGDATEVPMPGGGETFCRWTTRERERLQFFSQKTCRFWFLAFISFPFLGHVNAIMYIYIYVCVCVFFFNRRSSGFPKCFPHFHAGFGIPPLRRGAAWIRPMDLIPARRRSGKIVGR